MKRTRAERRNKVARIKAVAFERSEWKAINERGKWTRVKVNHRWIRTYVPWTAEELQANYRKAVRNEGKWRRPGVKPWKGCHYWCWICNPQKRRYWTEAEKWQYRQDRDDFNEYMGV